MGTQNRWKGPIGFENVPTGDNRFIETDALRWDSLPIPLRYTAEDVGAHDGAQVVGHIESVERIDLDEANRRLADMGEQPMDVPGNVSVIWADGDFDDEGVVGAEAMRHVAKKLTNGISMDLDDVGFEVRDGATVASTGVTLSNEDDEVMVTTGARVRAATIVAIPAFANARIVAYADLGDDENDESGLPIHYDADGEPLGEEDTEEPAFDGAGNPITDDTGAQVTGPATVNAHVDSGMQPTPANPDPDHDGDNDLTESGDTDHDFHPADSGSGASTDSGSGAPADSGAAESGSGSGESGSGESGSGAAAATTDKLDDPDIQALKDSIDALFQKILAKKQAAALQRRVQLARDGASFADVKHASEDWHNYDMGEKGPLAKPSELINDLQTAFDDLATIISADDTSTLGTLSTDDVLDYLSNDYHAETFDRVPLKKVYADLIQAAQDSDAAISSGDSKTIRESGVLVMTAARGVRDAVWNAYFIAPMEATADEIAAVATFRRSWDMDSDEICGVLGDLIESGEYMQDLGEGAEAFENALEALDGLDIGADGKGFVTQASTALGKQGPEDVDDALVALNSAANADDTVNSSRKILEQLIDTLEPYSAAGSVEAAVLETVQGASGGGPGGPYTTDEMRRIGQGVSEPGLESDFDVDYDVDINLPAPGGPVYPSDSNPGVSIQPAIVSAPSWGALTDTYKRKNWVEKAGGLPPYIKFLASHIRKANPSYTQSRAIAVAVNVAKRWARGGTVTGKGKAPHVNASTVAKAAAAVAQWEAMKAATGAKGAAKKATKHSLEEFPILGQLAALTDDDKAAAMKKANAAVAISLGFQPQGDGFTNAQGWTITPNDKGDEWTVTNADGETVGSPQKAVLDAIFSATDDADAHPVAPPNPLAVESGSGSGESGSGAPADSGSGAPAESGSGAPADSGSGAPADSGAAVESGSGSGSGESGSGSDSTSKMAAKPKGSMPDGSYPIATLQDLKNAIQAIGRAKHPDKVKAHIKSRAKALGHSELIPDNWSSTGTPLDDGFGDDEEAMYSSELDGPQYEPEQRALVASGAQIAERPLAAPIAPPRAWFSDPHLAGPTPITVTPEGRVYGHMATFDVCHLAMPNGAAECVTAPHSPSNYAALFHLGVVTTAEGTDVPVGRITMNTTHAGDSWNARRTLSHYENTGLAIADVHAGEDAYGIWLAGALRPDATPAQIRALKASPLSGDWRRTANGSMELAMALAVNQPGFPVPRPRGLVASGALTSLMAAGMLAPAKVIPPGKPGSFSLEDLRYLKKAAQRERDTQARELAERAMAASARAKVTAYAHKRQVEQKQKGN